MCKLHVIYLQLLKQIQTKLFAVVNGLFCLETLEMMIFLGCNQQHKKRIGFDITLWHNIYWTYPLKKKKEPNQNANICQCKQPIHNTAHMNHESVLYLFNSARYCSSVHFCMQLNVCLTLLCSDFNIWRPWAFTRAMRDFAAFSRKDIHMRAVSVLMRYCTLIWICLNETGITVAMRT